jgi:hypothetical protein
MILRFIQSLLGRPVEPDPFGLNAAFALRKQRRLEGYQRPERRRG